LVLQDSTDHFEKYLQKGADFILLGEAELTLVELVQAINNGLDDFSSIEGIAYCSDQDIIKTQRRKVMRDLDSLPFPAWDLLDEVPYRNSWLKHVGYFSMNMGTTRGCPFKCNWCAKPIYGNRYNSRSPQNVFDELKLMKDKFDFDHIWFCDDIFYQGSCTCRLRNSLDGCRKWFAKDFGCNGQGHYR
jgi:anaerobic magnesium-protoporphyrin IX monomethyl ester cyclase